MTAAPAIARLRRFAQGQPTAADLDWLAECANTYLATASMGVTLDAAVGVAARPGSSPWWIAENRDRRDDLIRRFADIAFPMSAPSERAALLAKEFKKYSDSSWPRERRNGISQCYAGTPRETLFKIFKTSDGIVPMSKKQISSILCR